MTLAQAIEARSLRVVEAATLPNAVRYLTVYVNDAADFLQLPTAVSYESKVYGKSGWDSDRLVAFYRTDVSLAWVVE